jgi:acetyltransferase-like isoleucine patch superfamily enzyme
MRRLLRPIARTLRSIAMSSRLFVVRSSGVSGGRGLRIYGRVRVFAHKGSTIQLGQGIVLNSTAKRNTLEARGPVILRTLTASSRILIGDDSGITSATISAVHEVAIGHRVLIGAGVLITDSDHHVVRPPLSISRRHLGLPAIQERDRVVIEDDVFLGARSIVLKGVKVGEGSVIGAGSVVASSIPPWSIAAGNPCKVIGTVHN